MKTINNPSEKRWPKLAERSAIKQAKLMELVNTVFYDIRKKGDKALLKYARKFDGFAA